MFKCFLVREGQELTLVDTSFPGSGDAILRAASSLRCLITKIALTHAHFDHVGSLDARVKAFARRASLPQALAKPASCTADFSLDPGESGKPLLGFPRVHSQIHKLLDDGDKIGSLCAVACPGHTPGHLAFVDVRDNSLLAGDSFMAQSGVIAAGLFGILFPMPWLFSWNPGTLRPQRRQTRCAQAIPPGRRPRQNHHFAHPANGPRRRDRSPPTSPRS